MLGKLKAAVAARRDPDFVIAGRTSALRVEGLEGAIERVSTYAAAGVDAIFAIGLETEAEIRALREASGLPIIAGPSLKAGPHERPALAAAGVALLLQGHQPISVAARALRANYRHLLAEGDPKELPTPGKRDKADLVRAGAFAATTEHCLK